MARKPRVMWMHLPELRKFVREQGVVKEHTEFVALHRDVVVGKFGLPHVNENPQDDDGEDEEMKEQIKKKAT